MEKSRVEAFSDGVFAIAITLLVLVLLEIDAKDALLGPKLRHEWLSYVAYVISFAVIGIMWVNHHAIFAGVVKVDRPLLFINLLLLMFVVVVPFPTSLLARHLNDEGSGSHVAAAAYSVNLFLCAIAFQLLWRWIVRRSLHERPPAAMSRTAEWRFGIGLFVYAGTIGLSYVNAKWTLLVHGLIAIYYVYDQLPTRTGDV